MNPELPGDDMRREEGAEVRPLTSPRREASLSKLGRGESQSSDFHPGPFSKRMRTHWTPIEISALIALWNERLPTREIAKRLGVSNNAIIGKAHRLGLAKRPTPIHPRKRSAEPTLLTLADLGPGQCRWPEGDPKEEGFHFCGKPIVEGKPYCADHCERAYVKRSHDKSDGFSLPSLETRAA